MRDPPESPKKARLRIVAAAAGSQAADGTRRPTRDRTEAVSGKRGDRLLEHAATAWAPLTFAGVALLVVRQAARVVDGGEASIAATMWLVFAAALECAFLAILVAHGRPALRQRFAARDTGYAIVACGVLALGAAFAFPWACDPDVPAARQTAACLAAATVLAATALFGARPRLAWAPPGVPIAWAVVDGFEATIDAAHVPALFVPALAIAILTGVVSRVVARLHRGAVDDLLATEARHRELVAARDAAEQADRDKSRFLAMASHDLRQPLHALGLFAGSLESGCAGPPASRSSPTWSSLSTGWARRSTR